MSTTAHAPAEAGTERPARTARATPAAPSAYQAYHMSLDDKAAPTIDGLTGDQRFFLAWAQSWRDLQRDANLRNQVMSNPHSPAVFRVQGVVRNMDEWYQAFDVKPEDKLFLPPEQRVHIW